MKNTVMRNQKETNLYSCKDKQIMTSEGMNENDMKPTTQKRKKFIVFFIRLTLDL